MSIHCRRVYAVPAAGIHRVNWWLSTVAFSLCPVHLRVCRRVAVTLSLLGWPVVACLGLLTTLLAAPCSALVAVASCLPNITQLCHTLILCRSPWASNQTLHEVAGRLADGASKRGHRGGVA